MLGTPLSGNCWSQLWFSNLLEKKQIGAAGIGSVEEKTLCLNVVLKKEWGVWMCGSGSESVCACLRICICVYACAFEKIESVRIMAMVVKRKGVLEDEDEEVCLLFVPANSDERFDAAATAIFVDIKPILPT